MVEKNTTSSYSLVFFFVFSCIYHINNKNKPVKVVLKSGTKYYCINWQNWKMECRSDKNIASTLNCLKAVTSLWSFIQESVPPLFFFEVKLLFIDLAAPLYMEFLGQGSDLSRSCDLCHSFGSAGSFNPLCQARNLTCILALQRHCWSHCTTTGTPRNYFCRFSVSLRFLN